MNSKMVQLISFSGIDGAGKSTQIAALHDALSQRGWKVNEIAFWDHAAILARFRAGVSLRLLANEVECNGNVPLRRDKNVRAWYLTLVRSAFYLLDALSLRVAVARVARSGSDYIILDRWTYDQLVHIKSRNFLARAYIKVILALAPSPDLPLVLDASPDAAFKRKPEYPLEFLNEYRQSFLAMKKFVPKLQIVPPGSIDEVRTRILEAVLNSSGARAPSPAQHHELIGNLP